MVPVDIGGLTGTFSPIHFWKHAIGFLPLQSLHVHKPCALVAHTKHSRVPARVRFHAPAASSVSALRAPHPPQHFCAFTRRANAMIRALWTRISIQGNFPSPSMRCMPCIAIAATRPHDVWCIPCKHVLHHSFSTRRESCSRLLFLAFIAWPFFPAFCPQRCPIYVFSMPLPQQQHSS